MNETTQKLLSYAEHPDFLDDMRALIKEGADVNATNIYGDTPLMIAATEGNFKAICLLLAEGADTSKRNCDGDTALSAAAKWSHDAAIIKLLLQSASKEMRKEAMQAACEEHGDIVKVIAAIADFDF